MKAAEKAADFLFPWGTYCVCCGNFIDKSRTYCLCDHCIRKIRWGHVKVEGQIPVDSVRACMKYGLYERRLIFELKYNGHTYMARILAQILYDRLISDPDRETAALFDADYIVPVPVHRSRMRQRGFNQAERIALHLGRLMGVEVLGKGLIRKTSTAAQRSVAGRERFANLEGAFAPGFGSMEALGLRIAGKKLILLDDIFTTGATATHCALILKEAGAARVDVLTVAAGNHEATGFFGAQDRAIFEENLENLTRNG